MNEHLELAKKLGLNEYESKAYIALLGVHAATASGVSKLSLIPRARVYDVLSTLEKKGFIEKKLSKPLAYSALPPLHVAKNIFTYKKSLFEKEVEEIQNIGQLLEQRASRPQGESGFAEEVKLLRGQDNIYSKIGKELESALESVVFSATEAGLARKKAKFHKTIESLSRKGVKVNFRQQELRCCVIDKKTVFLFLNPDTQKRDEESALLIKNPFLALQFLKKTVQ
ncbi:MAG: helix-turn-helix domain-containing protein [archaeon]